MNCYFVTGSSRGIGKALVNELLLDNTARVFGIARNSSVYNDNYIHFHLDLSDLESVKQFHFPVLKNVKQIVLVNNAGTLGQVAHSGRLDDDKIISGFNVNIVSPALLINKFLAAYEKTDCEKVILNISSGAAQRPIDGWSIYCPAKAAIDMLSRTVQLEAEIDKSRTRVYAIAPGVVDTAMQDQIRQVSEKDFSTVERFILLKENHELLHAEVVARRLVYFLQRHRDFNEVVLSLNNTI